MARSCARLHCVDLTRVSRCSDAVCCTPLDEWILHAAVGRQARGCSFSVGRRGLARADRRGACADARCLKARGAHVTAAPAPGTANVNLSHLRALVCARARARVDGGDARANGKDVQTHTRNPSHFTGKQTALVKAGVVPPRRERGSVAQASQQGYDGQPDRRFSMTCTCAARADSTSISSRWTAPSTAPVTTAEACVGSPAADVGSPSCGVAAPLPCGNAGTSLSRPFVGAGVRTEGCEEEYSGERDRIFQRQSSSCNGQRAVIHTKNTARGAYAAAPVCGGLLLMRPASGGHWHHQSMSEGEGEGGSYRNALWSGSSVCQ